MSAKTFYLFEEDFLVDLLFYPEATLLVNLFDFAVPLDLPALCEFLRRLPICALTKDKSS